ncbi:MAG: alpha/beta hydrolase [Inquilinus sp.]|nr:alpha/beta hydrolase [Inquilinus sp.]
MPSDPVVHRRRMTLAAAGPRLDAVSIEPAAGRASGALPLVFLHEGLGSIAQWTARGGDVPARLVAATGCPALVYERQGYAGSDPLTAPRAPRYLYDEAWQVLPRVLDEAGIGSCIPIGHSDGASIALLFAARFPGRTAGLVSEAAHVVVEAITLAGIRTAVALFEASDGKLRTALSRYHGERTEAVFRSWADAWLSPGFAGFDMTGELARVTAPVFALQGETDEYGSPRQLELIADGVGGPAETWLVPDCGHVPHHQAADRVLPRLAAFVGKALDR